MAQLSLAKLLKKREFAPLLNRMVSCLETSIIIEDDLGGLLMATENADRQNKYPVNSAGNVIGWVYGSEKVSAIAALLSYHAESEAEKRNLTSETLNKYKEITFLYDMVEQVSSCLDTREIARLIIEQAKKVISLTGIDVLMLNHDAGIMELVASYGGEADSEMTVNPGIGVAGAVWSSGRSEIVNDLPNDPRFDPSSKISSMMCTPLKAKDRVIGIIKLGSEDPINYTAEDLKLFNTLASLAAVAMENASLYEQLKEAFYTTVYTLAETIEKRDPYTGNHTKRVMEYSLAIGRTMGLGEEDLARLQLGAVLHDIGKIGVRDNVLLKESALNDVEFAEIKKHAIFGEEIISRIASLKTAIPGIRQHHEKFNGRGYPDGLAGEDIDITARIIAVADSYDAMTTDRPYRKGLTLDDAFEELRKYSGSQFDPEVVKAFLASDVVEAYFTANTRGKILL